MARKITEISLSQTFLGDFLISVHSITAVSLAIVITEKSMEGWLMKQKYYLALTAEEWRLMLFQTYGDRRNPAVLFFHAMGVTGASSEPIARYLQDRYFCILPTSTVYCEEQKYVSKLDEIRQGQEG